MATVWITYAWNDNNQQDVDFVAQELRTAGATVKLDRWNIGAGKRLWDQIESYITKPNESDAWVLVATQNSLQSEPCKEEYAYALDRALNTRGGSFPVIGLFLGPIDSSLIPAGIKTRLYVSITDADWKERVVAAAEGRQPRISQPNLQPYAIHVHDLTASGGRFAVELRPRAGVWAPFFAAVPAAEQTAVKLSIMIGPRGKPPMGGILTMCGEGPSDDQQWWVAYAGDEATPTRSYYAFCHALPTRMAFGVNNGSPQFVHAF